MADETGTDLLSRRMSGVLLHPTSLPGRGPVGTLGPEAHAFIDFLAAAGQRCWQMLPVGPTGDGGSPYTSISAFAGNTWLLAHEPLVEGGWVASAEPFIHTPAGDGRPGGDRVDFDAAEQRAERLVKEARQGFEISASAADREAFAEFREREALWLEDYALFKALRDAFGHKAWTDWPDELTTRQDEALAAAREDHADAIDVAVFGQFLFERQWSAVKDHAADRGVYLVGDIPIYVAGDSADVWSDQALFELDGNGLPIHVAGVPPDYFSETGQRWGNPLYRWDRMKANDYAWWTRRFARTFQQFDIVRIDHFRGFEAFWSIPASEPTAVNGEWVDGPGEDLFKTVEANLGGSLEVIAEDLGIITDGVRALRDDLGFPGMAILQFAFSGDPNHPYLPENVRERSVIYPGTHDNDTSRGWYEQLGDHERYHVHVYFDRTLDDPAWTLIETAWRSRADLAVAQLQDFLSLGTEARLNIPGKADGNWTWRLDERGRLDGITGRMRELTEETGRTG